MAKKRKSLVGWTRKNWKQDFWWSYYGNLVLPILKKKPKLVTGFNKTVKVRITIEEL